mmetsp:Transcript_15077/g.21516  ORF Transcript_15077/g.21516 Transcript_15077/m.21516 type:complete len:524 (-) Transcript_15077:323-1894(-)
MGGEQSTEVSGPVFINGKYYSASYDDLKELEKKEKENNDDENKGENNSERSITQKENPYQDDDNDDNNGTCGCNFFSFCGDSNGNIKSLHGAYDKMGSPIPDTPPHVRRSREQRALFGKIGLDMEESVRSHASIFKSASGSSRILGSGGLKGEYEMLKKYELREVLGVGSTSTCHRCVRRSSGRSYACKVIDKKHIEQQFRGMISQFQTEIEALRSLKHPNIIKLYDVYATDDKIYIVMELMQGGELFDYVVKKGTLNEEEASHIVRQIVNALVYMHDKNIIHRDLKPENLLLVRQPRGFHDAEVKIIDFGLSKHMNAPITSSFLGTAGYLAPEMLQRREYSKSVDAWALGVIVFVLLCGCLPFDDDSNFIPSDATIRAKFKLRFPRWAVNISPSAKDLLFKLLDINPRTRCTAEDALQHPWVKGETADKKSLLKSPGKIILASTTNTPSSKSKNSHAIAMAQKAQMNQMMMNRARANSAQRGGGRNHHANDSHHSTHSNYHSNHISHSHHSVERQLVRKTSI